MLTGGNTLSRADDLLPIPPRGGHDIDTQDGLLPLLAPPELKAQVSIEERFVPGPEGAPDVRVIMYRPKAETGTLPVVVSIPPLVWLVEATGGELVEVESLVGAGESPSTYQPTDAQISRALRARLFFRIGVPFERGAWLEALASLVDSTGGRICRIARTEQAAEAFRHILRELREQYVIGYYPSNNRNDGAWHDVRVLVRAPGVRVRARGGYFDDQL